FIAIWIPGEGGRGDAERHRDVWTMRRRVRAAPWSRALFHSVFGAVNTRPGSGRPSGSGIIPRLWRFSGDSPMTRPLAALIDEILRFTWSANPTAATAVGIHDYDDHLVDCSTGALDARLRGTTAYRSRRARLVDSIPDMTPDESLDARVLLGALDVESRVLEEARPACRDPVSYLDEILYGVYYL